MLDASFASLYAIHLRESVYSSPKHSREFPSFMSQFEWSYSSKVYEMPFDKLLNISMPAMEESPKVEKKIHLETSNDENQPPNQLNFVEIPENNSKSRSFQTCQQEMIIVNKSSSKIMPQKQLFQNENIDPQLAQNESQIQMKPSKTISQQSREEDDSLNNCHIYDEEHIYATQSQQDHDHVEQYPQQEHPQQQQTQAFNIPQKPKSSPHEQPQKKPEKQSKIRSQPIPNIKSKPKKQYIIEQSSSEEEMPSRQQKKQVTFEKDIPFKGNKKQVIFEVIKPTAPARSLNMQSYDAVNESFRQFQEENRKKGNKYEYIQPQKEDSNTVAIMDARRTTLVIDQNLQREQIIKSLEKKLDDQVVKVQKRKNAKKEKKQVTQSDMNGKVNGKQKPQQNPLPSQISSEEEVLSMKQIPQARQALRDITPPQQDLQRKIEQPVKKQQVIRQEQISSDEENNSKKSVQQDNAKQLIFKEVKQQQPQVDKKVTQVQEIIDKKPKPALSKKSKQFKELAQSNEINSEEEPNVQKQKEVIKHKEAKPEPQQKLKAPQVKHQETKPEPEQKQKAPEVQQKEAKHEQEQKHKVSEVQHVETKPEPQQKQKAPQVKHQETKSEPEQKQKAPEVKPEPEVENKIQAPEEPMKKKGKKKTNKQQKKQISEIASEEEVVHQQIKKQEEPKVESKITSFQPTYDFPSKSINQLPRSVMPMITPKANLAFDKDSTPQEQRNKIAPQNSLGQVIQKENSFIQNLVQSFHRAQQSQLDSRSHLQSKRDFPKEVENIFDVPKKAVEVPKQQKQKKAAKPRSKKQRMNDRAAEEPFLEEKKNSKQAPWKPVIHKWDDMEQRSSAKKYIKYGEERYLQIFRYIPGLYISKQEGELNHLMDRVVQTTISIIFEIIVNPQVQIGPLPIKITLQVAQKTPKLENGCVYMDEALSDPMDFVNCNVQKRLFIYNASPQPVRIVCCIKTELKGRNQ